MSKGNSITPSPERNLSPQQERLLVSRYNNMLNDRSFDYINLAMLYLLNLYTDKLNEEDPNLKESYSIGIDNMRMLFDVHFH